MPEDNEVEVTPNAAEAPVPNQLPPPLNWVAGFLDKYFSRMPGTVQVIVFITFAVYFILVSAKFFFPEVWQGLLGEDVEIQGVLTKPNWEGVVDSTGGFFLSGTRLFVTKDHPNPGSPRYYFRWILKVRQDEMNNPAFFSIMEGSTEKGSFMITPRELLDRVKGGYVRLEFRDIPLTRMVTIGFHEDSASARQANFASLPGAVAAPRLQKEMSESRIPPDSVALLLGRIVRPEYASAELKIRQVLLGGGTLAMKIVADSLRRAVLENRNATAATYALVLSDFPQLYLFSSSASYSSIFNDPFYEKACRLLHSGSDKESGYMATLLHNLQDARCLKYVFDAFRRARSETSKGLCLYVIDAFAGNSSTQLRQQVNSRLESLESQPSSAQLKSAVEQTRIKFEESLKEKK
ncbi:MAG: hypothetical protein M1378_12550 [Bacteroidetes bacterium]|nr:hypothetical protein [Bacteroidota bacterium]